MLSVYSTTKSMYSVSFELLQFNFSQTILLANVTDVQILTKRVISIEFDDVVCSYLNKIKKKSTQSETALKTMLKLSSQLHG